MKRISDIINERPEMAEAESGRTNYARLLSTHEWVSFAMDVKRQRDNTCEHCHARLTPNLLNVHHWYYRKDRLPWQYHVTEVAVLCAGCHEEAHAALDRFRRYVWPLLLPEVMRVLCGALAAAFSPRARTTYLPQEFALAVAALASDGELVKRLAKTGNEFAIPRDGIPQGDAKAT